MRRKLLFALICASFQYRRTRVKIDHSFARIWFDLYSQNRYLRFAQLLGSGKAKRLCASAIVAPIVSSVNVRSTDILREKNENRDKKLIDGCCLFRLSSTTNWAAADPFRFGCLVVVRIREEKKKHQSINTPISGYESAARFIFYEICASTPRANLFVPQG